MWECDPYTVKGPDVVFHDKICSFGELNPKYAEDVPSLAVEVRSPNDRMSKITRRISQFLKWGVELVWLIDPEDRTLAVYRRDRPAEVLEADEELIGDGILPDFRCLVADFFYIPDGANEGAEPVSA